MTVEHKPLYDTTMNCPHCKQEIDDALIAKYLAAKGGKSGGKKSRRIITPEQQAKMQEARKKGEAP